MKGLVVFLAAAMAFSAFVAVGCRAIEFLFHPGSRPLQPQTFGVAAPPGPDPTPEITPEPEAPSPPRKATALVFNRPESPEDPGYLKAVLNTATLSFGDLPSAFLQEDAVTKPGYLGVTEKGLLYHLN